MKKHHLWLLAGVLLTGCSTEGCNTDSLRALFNPTGGDGTLQPYQIAGVKRDFCSKFRGAETFFAGQTGSSAVTEDSENPNLPALLQPYLRVTINGQSAEMNSVMLDTMRDYLDHIPWPEAAAASAGEAEYCHNAILVLSENSLLLEFPDQYFVEPAPRRRDKVNVTFVSISSAWQKGPDRAWRLLQVHMSDRTEERDASEFEAPAAGEKEGASAQEAQSSKNSGGCVGGWNALRCQD